MQPILALILVNLFLGAGYPFIKEVVSYFQPAEWVFLRLIACTVLLLLIVRKQFVDQGISILNLFWLVVASLFGVVANNIFLVEGLYRTTSSHAAMINATVPLQALLFGWFFIREKIDAQKIIGVVLGFGGIIYLLRIDQITMLQGDLLSLANSTAYALYLVVARKNLSGLKPMVAFTWLCLLGLIGTGFYADWNFNYPALFAAPKNIFWITLYLIVVPMVLCFPLNLWALKKIEASQAALYVYLQPMVASGLSYFMKGEIPDQRFLISAALILGGLVVGNWKSSRNSLAS